MSEMLSFKQFRQRPVDWDTMVNTYWGKTLFHESAWHEHVLDIHPAGRMQYFEILKGGRRVGLHCGLLIRKLGVPIHGSPLGGTGTNFMGPLTDPDVSAPEVAQGLKSLLGVRTGLHLETAHFHLDPQVMAAAGFNVHSGVTHLIPLPAAEEEAWAQLKSSCRNRVRKAQQQGLRVEYADRESVVDEFFPQFVEVYGKQDMVTPFDIERPRSLFKRLAARGRILPLAIHHGDEVVATGLFPYDDRCIYFWGAASWLSAQHLCPNELLHWEVIRFAVERGIKAYNMCGGASQFKDKFGGTDVPYLHYSVSALPGMGMARDWYRKVHFARLKRN